MIVLQLQLLPLRIDDGFFIFQNREELHQATINLNANFAKFGLTMHIGSNAAKSKSEAMFFPATLKQAKLEVCNNIVQEVGICIEVAYQVDTFFMYRIECIVSSLFGTLGIVLNWLYDQFDTLCIRICTCTVCRSTVCHILLHMYEYVHVLYVEVQIDVHFYICVYEVWGFDSR
jgi:hypothetical protein